MEIIPSKFFLKINVIKAIIIKDKMLMIVESIAILIYFLLPLYLVFLGYAALIHSNLK